MYIAAICLYCGQTASPLPVPREESFLCFTAVTRAKTGASVIKLQNNWTNNGSDIIMVQRSDDYAEN